jgi:6-pyruvoyltetrahydropterin/6-carboxytetrahydropterin synthase
MLTTVYKRASFDAAHHLPNYEGKCKNVHGHHWVVEVGLKGDPHPQAGMVVDFSILSVFLKEYVVGALDHRDINTIIPNPTAENIAHWILKQFRIALPMFKESSNPKLHVVRIWETPDSYAEVILNDY